MKRSNKDRLWLVIAAVMLAAFGWFLYADAHTYPPRRCVSYTEFGGLRKGQNISTLVRIKGEPIREYAIDHSCLVYLYLMGGPASDNLHVYLKNNKIDSICYCF
jgi:hypothetical protein